MRDVYQFQYYSEKRFLNLAQKVPQQPDLPLEKQEHVAILPQVKTNKDKVRGS